MDENCHVVLIQKIATTEEKQMVEMALLAVWGMGCPNCAERVRNSLLSLHGVVDAYVDHTACIAEVAFNSEMVNTEMLINAVSSAGNDGRHEYGARLLSRRMMQ